MAEESTSNMQNQYHELRQRLVQLGANVNTASVLLCLHKHGASTSKQLQERCNIRQPDVSMAISELREMNLVHYAPRSEPSRGRPAHVYRLRMALEQTIQPFVSKARKQAKEILNKVDAINNLVTDIEPTVEVSFMAA